MELYWLLVSFLIHPSFNLTSPVHPLHHIPPVNPYARAVHPHRGSTCTTSTWFLQSNWLGLYWRTVFLFTLLFKPFQFSFMSMRSQIRVIVTVALKRDFVQILSKEWAIGVRTSFRFVKAISFHSNFIFDVLTWFFSTNCSKKLYSELLMHSFILSSKGSLWLYDLDTVSSKKHQEFNVLRVF